MHPLRLVCILSSKKWCGVCVCVRRVMFVVWCACLCRVRSGGQGWTATAVEKASGETKVIKSVACDNIKAGNVALMEAKVLQVRMRREIYVYCLMSNTARGV